MSSRDGIESEYSYVTDTDDLTDDTLDELLKRFTCKFSPTYVFKLRDQRGPLVYGADVTCDSELRDPSLALMMKPVDRKFWLRRVRVSHTYDISVRSRKLSWWVFTLDLEAELNPIQKTRDVGFRLATTWDVTGGRVQKKNKFEPLQGVHCAVEWNVSYDLPEMKGRFRNSGDSGGMETSLGYAHGEISKLELAVWPSRLACGREPEENERKKEELKLLLGEKDGGRSTKGIGSMIDGFVANLNSRLTAVAQKV